MSDSSTNWGFGSGPAAPQVQHLTLVHSARPVPFSYAALPASLSQLAGPGMDGRRRGRPGRRPHVLLIDRSLPRPDGEPKQGFILGRALRRLSYEVVIAPADGELDSEIDDLSQHGIACLGRPVYRSIEEVLRQHADVFDLVCLMGAELARAYEPLVRLHGPAARVLCCLPGLVHPELARQAQHRPELIGAARAAQRREVMAAFGCDAAIVAAAEDAEVLQAALPQLAVHLVPWSDATAIDAALHRAVGNQARSNKTVP